MKAKNSEKSVKFRSIQDIFKDENSKNRLLNYVDEAVRLKMQMQDKATAIKEIRETAKDELKLNPKVFNYYVGAVLNDDYVARKESLDELSTLIEMVLMIDPDQQNTDED